MTVSLTVERRQERGVDVLAVAGELDMLTAPRLVTEARDVLRARPAALCLDLTGVTFADSAGLAGLVNVHRSCLRCDARMVIACVDGPVRRVLALSGVDRMLEVAGTPGEAVDAVAP